MLGGSCWFHDLLLACGLLVVRIDFMTLLNLGFGCIAYFFISYFWPSNLRC